MPHCIFKYRISIGRNYDERLANLYQLLSFRHCKAIFGSSVTNLIKLYQYSAILGSRFLLYYIQLAFRCLDGSTWQVITILVKTAMKTCTHIQPAPVT